MTVQITPSIEEMTPIQCVELMEELWQVLLRRPEDIEVPEWHLRVLEERELALANGEDEFIDLDVAMADIRREIENRKRA